MGMPNKDDRIEREGSANGIEPIAFKIRHWLLHLIEDREANGRWEAVVVVLEDASAVDLPGHRTVRSPLLL